MSVNFAVDINRVQQVSAVPAILDIIRKTTGMGFVAVARVTKEHWVACAVDDGLNFGLVPGGELELNSTICYEIEQHHRPVIIDNVSLDETFCDHHTPKLYGFQSYISVPITLDDGSFFWHLVCY